MTTLITGACGFVARHLSTRLKRDGCRVLGVDQWADCKDPVIEYSQVNILDSAALSRLMSKSGVERIYHLAGISYLPDADATPRHALEINIMGAASILDAMHTGAPSSRMLVVGSSKEYGSNARDLALSEDTPGLLPTDFYGVSKFAAELIGRRYVSQFGLDVRFTRSFNHTGPGQSPRFVCSEWARRIVEIDLGLASPVIQVGDIGHDIDFTDVRDTADAYVSILERGAAGAVYNVCSGQTVSLEYILTYLRGKTTKDVVIEGIEQKRRSHKASPHLAGDNAKLRGTGWQRTIPIEKTLDDLFDYWMGELADRSPSPGTMSPTLSNT